MKISKVVEFPSTSSIWAPFARFTAIGEVFVAVAIYFSSLEMIFFASGQALIIQPMAISLGFGIAWATVLNLYYVPLMYSVIYKVKN